MLGTSRFIGPRISGFTVIQKQARVLPFYFLPLPFSAVILGKVAGSSCHSGCFYCKLLLEDLFFGWLYVISGWFTSVILWRDCLLGYLKIIYIIVINSPVQVFPWHFKLPSSVGNCYLLPSFQKQKQRCFFKREYNYSLYHFNSLLLGKF